MEAFKEGSDMMAMYTFTALVAVLALQRGHEWNVKTHWQRFRPNVLAWDSIREKMGRNTNLQKMFWRRN